EHLSGLERERLFLEGEDLFDEALDVVDDAAARDDLPQKHCRCQQDHPDAEKEDERDLEHRPRLDVTHEAVHLPSTHPRRLAGRGGVTGDRTPLAAPHPPLTVGRLAAVAVEELVDRGAVCPRSGWIVDERCGLSTRAGSVVISGHGPQSTGTLRSRIGRGARSRHSPLSTADSSARATARAEPRRTSTSTTSPS